MRALRRSTSSCLQEGVDVVRTEPVSPVAPFFDAFAAGDGERLRRVLVARYGVEIGNDVCADALAYAWEHWERVGPMDNPVGYLYRVAQSASRRHRRWRQRPQLPIELPARPSE